MTDVIKTEKDIPDISSGSDHETFKRNVPTGPKSN